ncbi:MAG TPA: DNA recombination protein RmuC [Ferrovibrio sp.]|uniref:DNA recombination protein RmuC n=1 Tax=Ferrovibrio sp. TaxID=1917215 RepID=UPI002ED13B82
MDISIPIGFAILGLLLLAVLWQLRRSARAPGQTPESATEIATLTARLEAAQAASAAAEAALAELRPKLESAAAARAAAETRQAELALQLEKAAAETAAARAAREEAERARIEQERNAALARQQLAEQEKRIADFEKTVLQMTEAAKAATLETGKQLGAMLLETHKREADEQKKQTFEHYKQTSEGLLQQFAAITDTVSRLHQQVGDSRKTIETVHRALSHPGGAGRLAEIGLENTLKAFGLQPGHDFIVQYHAAGDGERGSLRPDAVVFLPGDAVLVIDSKASKLLLDHAEAEDAAAEAAALAQLAQRMNLHLRALAAKDYGNAVLSTYRELKRGGALKRSLIAMALPNEAAIEKLRQAAPDFERRAAEANIVVVGPSALAAIIAVSRMQIDSGRQVENLEAIIDAVAKLVDSAGTALAQAERVGKGLQKASEEFETFSRSVNARLLPRIRRLAKFGIRAKSAPAALPSFNVNIRHADDIIDASVEEVDAGIEAPARPRLAAGGDGSNGGAS